MKYLKVANMSDLLPRYAVLGTDEYPGKPFHELLDLGHDDPAADVYHHFDENTTYVEFPLELVNVAYALAYKMGLREGTGYVQFDDIGRPQIQVYDEWYLVITATEAVIYR